MSDENDGSDGDNSDPISYEEEEYGDEADQA